MSTSTSTILMATPALISPTDHAALFPSRHAVERDTRPRLLDDILKCWVPGCGGSMGHGKDSGGKAYGCNHTAHDAKYNRMVSMDALTIDRLAIEAIQHVLPTESVIAGTAAELERELKARESMASLELAQISGALIMARRNYDEALSRALKFDSSTQHDMQPHLDALKRERSRLESLDAELRAQIEKERSDVKALTSNALVFFNALEKLKSKLPFRPQTDAELRIYESCRAMLAKVELRQNGEETHDVTITVRLSADTDTKLGIKKEVVFKDRLVMAWRTNIEYRNSEQLAKVRARGGELTDDEYNSLPEELMRYHQDERYRHVLNAFARETDEITFRGIMRLEDTLVDCEHIIQHMLIGGRRELLQQHLQKTRGSEYRLLAVARETKFSELGYLARAKHPVVLLPIARPGGPERLSDAQWYAIADEVKAIKIQSRYGDDHPRNALDRYFALLRSDLPFLHVESWHCEDKPWGSLVPDFRMGKHPTKLKKILDILLRMEGWRLPKNYDLPVVPWRSQKARDYDEALIAEIAATVEKVEPTAPNVPPIDRYACGGLIVNLTEESILLPDGTRWHTAVPQKRMIQTLMFEGIKRSDYKRYAKHTTSLHGLMFRLADRLEGFSDELAGALKFDTDTETYRIDLPVMRLS